MTKPHDFFIASNGDDTTGRPDDCDAPFRTVSAILAYCHEHEIACANLLEWRVSSWHRVGGEG